MAPRLPRPLGSAANGGRAHTEDPGAVEYDDGAAGDRDERHASPGRIKATLGGRV